MHHACWHAIHRTRDVVVLACCCCPDVLVTTAHREREEKTHGISPPKWATMRETWLDHVQALQNADVIE